jgi:hypothetical protein
MFTEQKNALPKNFTAQARVWIYQADRPFLHNEEVEIINILQKFTANWKSHGAEVRGFTNIFYQQFIVLAADESITVVSGCSTDSSVKVIQQISTTYNLDLFNRQKLAFLINEHVKLINLNEFNIAFVKGIINENSLYFNNNVLNKEQFDTDWLLPIKNSWLKSRLVTK